MGQVSAYLLWLLATLLVATIMPLASTLDQRRIVLVCYAVAASVIVLSRILTARRYTSLSSGNVIALAGSAIVISLGTLSAAGSPLASWSLLEVSVYFLLLLSVGALASAFKILRYNSSGLVAGLFILPIGLYVFAACTIVFASLISNLPLTFPEPVNGFANIRFFNQYQTWLLPFLPAALLLPSPTSYIRRGLWHGFVFIIAAFFWALFWRTTGRGTVCATVIACCVVLIFCGSNGRRYTMLTAILALSGFAVAWFMFNDALISRSETHLLSSVSLGRQYLWGLCIDLIGQHPWLGIGPMQFAALDTGKASHPHDALLQWAVEWGIPAAVLISAGLLWMLSHWLRFVFRARDRDDHQSNVLRVALTASLIGGAAHSLVSGIVVMPASQFMLILVTALAYAVWRDAHPKPTVAHPLPRSIMPTVGVTFIIAVAGLYTAAFTINSYPYAAQHSRKNSDLYRRNSNQPRFWADGTLAGISENEEEFGDP